MYMRIRKAREDAGYTREKFAELLDVSVSYMAEVERGRTGISVKMLIKICDVLGLSADYVLFGEKRCGDEQRAQRIGRIDSRYLPLLDGVIGELLALNRELVGTEVRIAAGALRPRNDMLFYRGISQKNRPGTPGLFFCL